VMGLFAFVVFTAQFEYQTLRNPTLWLLFPLTACGFVYAIRRVRSDTPQIDKQIMFEDIPSSGFELLDLQRSLR